MKIFLDALSQRPTISIGTQALIIGSLEIISRCFSGAEFLMLSSFPEIEKSYLADEPFKVKLVQRSRSQLGAIADVLAVTKEADLVVSAWGDGYITTPPHKILHKCLFLKYWRKPLVLFPSSIGPFKGNLKRALAVLGLRKFDCLMARDTVTYNYLSDLGLHHAHLVPDTAFILEPTAKDKVDSLLRQEGIPAESSFIGLNISQLLNQLAVRKQDIDYVVFMAELARYLADRYARRVLLIPHQILPASFREAREDYRTYQGDDRIAIKAIMDLLGDYPKVTPLLGEYTSRELKGIIGRCEIFVGGRMHSVIAALSQGIPSVLIQYSHKAIGVMDTLDLRDYVWDISAPPDQLFTLADRTWQNKSRLRQKLLTDMVEVKKKVGLAGELLEETAGI